MKFDRLFTKNGTHPFDEVTWVNRDSRILRKNGEIVFEQTQVEFPDFWSQYAVDIMTEKYFAYSLTDSRRETSLKQPIIRIANWYYEKGLEDKYFSSKKDAEVFRDELIYVLLHQYASFNSPVWFNVGVQDIPQVSACYIVSAKDTMKSISENMNIEMNIFRNGSGAGSNRSNLRSSYEFVSSGGKAMGPLVAEEIYDKIAKATKSGGKTRRAAKMVELNIDHGDIEDFISQKATIEKAAKVLVDAGWNHEFDDPKGAYGLLGLQNFNSSISVFNTFMQMLENNRESEWALIERNPTDPSYGSGYIRTKKTSQGCFEKWNDDWYLITDKNYFRVLKWIKVLYLWNLICESAWECADPGLQFYDTINKWNTCKSDGDITGSNPCSEYFHLEDTSCNLASHNLIKYFDKTGQFLQTYFIYVTRLLITAMDISVHNSSYPTSKITKKTIQYRNLGLGYTNLGITLLLKGFPYDSDDARNYAGALTALLSAVSYHTSAEIAEELGPFERYPQNIESMSNVLNMHMEAIDKLNTKISVEDSNNIELLNILKSAFEYFPHYLTPCRNAQTTVIAPAGTISLILDADTTGIEPVIGLVTYKKLVGGGYLKLVIPQLKIVLKNLKYTELEIEDILKCIENNPDDIIKCKPLRKEHLTLFATSMSHTLPITPIAHIKMMAAAQPFLSGAISKTVNLPNSATVEDISNMYLQAWKLNLKSIAVYRDNCKVSQPLNVNKELKTQRVMPVRKPLPSTCPGSRHKFKIGGQSGFLNFGFYPDTGDLGDVFVEVSKRGSTLNGLINSLAIAISMMLQYGIPPEEIIEAFENLDFEPSGLTQGEPLIRFASSIPDYIVKYMRIVIDRNKESLLNTEENLSNTEENFEVSLKTFTGEMCPQCGHPLIRTGKCLSCRNCGNDTGSCG